MSAWDVAAERRLEHPEAHVARKLSTYPMSLDSALLCGSSLWTIGTKEG